MKKIIWILPIALLILMACKSNSEVISTEKLKEIARQKVIEMQHLIGFSDYQAEKLIYVEYAFQQKMQKIDNFFVCNKIAEREKLKQQRDIDIQKYLPRDEYIKYEGGNFDSVKKSPLRGY